MQLPVALDIAEAEHPAPAGARAGEPGVPLVVDLDGTLTTADVTIEAMVRYARRGILNCIRLALWMVRGRPFTKTMLARHCPVAADELPLRPEVIELVGEARRAGSPVILASASHHRNVARIACHTGLFEAAIGTRRRRNLKGSAKVLAIRERLGAAPFDYVGDSRADASVWAASRRAYSVGHVPRGGRVEALPCARPSALRAALKSMRPHQWAKNLLILVPVLTAGLATDAHVVLRALAAASLFSLVASSVYLLNDILDVDADRQHKTKCRRPVAAGLLSIPGAAALALALCLPAFAAAWLVLGPRFALVLTSYLCLTSAYSLRLKAVMALDAVALACLYTLRIVAGAVAIGVSLSFWLLTFSTFLFLSLAYLKRYTELSVGPRSGDLVRGRGYTRADLDIVGMSGIAAGMVSILVLALFINSVESQAAYRAPELLWPVCLILLYWINRIWMMARRGEVEGDPVAFAIKDRRSIAMAICCALFFAAAQGLRLG